MPGKGYRQDCCAINDKVEVEAGREFEVFLTKYSALGFQYFGKLESTCSEEKFMPSLANLRYRVYSQEGSF